MSIDTQGASSHHSQEVILARTRRVERTVSDEKEIKGAAMTSERTEHQATVHALKEVFDYISPGTNEGISFSLSRLTDDLFTDSFLAGGDISLFTPSGQRGSIRSQDSQGSVLSSNGGAPSQFPINLTIDLSTGKGSGSWTLPDGAAQSPTFDIQWVKTVNRPEGTMLLFAGETSSDDATYSLALLLI